MSPEEKALWPRPEIIRDAILAERFHWDEEQIRRQRVEWIDDLLTYITVMSEVQSDLILNPTTAQDENRWRGQPASAIAARLNIPDNVPAEAVLFLVDAEP